jgi:hypothetical protein
VDVATTLIVIIVAIVVVVTMGVTITAVKSDTPPPFSIGNRKQLIATLPPRRPAWP